MQVIQNIKISFKSFFLKLFSSLKFSSVIFISFNFIWSIVYLFCLTERAKDYDLFQTIIVLFEGTKDYDSFQTIIHTFIASFTLSIPKFVDFPIHNQGYWLDLLVLIHVFVAYLFLGILISMVYRKATRS